MRRQGAWRRRLGVLPTALPTRRRRRLPWMPLGFLEVAVQNWRTHSTRSHRAASSELPIAAFSPTWQAPTFHRALKSTSLGMPYSPCLPPYRSPRPFSTRPKTRRLPEPTRVPGLKLSPETISPLVDRIRQLDGVFLPRPGHEAGDSRGCAPARPVAELVECMPPDFGKRRVAMSNGSVVQGRPAIRTRCRSTEAKCQDSTL